jgi:Tfp pilus assembly protein PilO
VRLITRTRPWQKLLGGRRNVLYLLVVATLAVLAYQFVVVRLVESERRVKEEIALKAGMLARYNTFIRTGREIEEEHGQMVQRVEAIKSELLPGETPQISAANLQEILKKLSERNSIEIRSFRIGEPKEIDFYLKVPVMIDISPIKGMASLAYFLYDIENGEKLLIISDLNLTTPNMRNPAEVRGSLTVTGFAKNPHPKGKIKEG